MLLAVRLIEQVGAYAGLAAAAEAGQKDGYEQASQAIAGAEQRLQARR